MNAPAPVIQTHDLTRTYMIGKNVVHALSNVNLQIDHGEFVAIAGPSGSGKSTLLNLIGCLDTPSKGEYYLDGIKIDTSSPLADIRRDKIGFVFQFFNLLPKHTALENVALPMIYKGVSSRERNQRAEKLLNQLGLGERTHHRPNELSGGQKQRVAIARALANQPKIVLADEPTGNLDSKTGEILLQELKKLNQQGTTLIVVTHDDSIAQRADRTIRLLDGKIVS